MSEVTFAEVVSIRISLWSPDLAYVPRVSGVCKATVSVVLVRPSVPRV